MVNVTSEAMAVRDFAPILGLVARHHARQLVYLAGVAVVHAEQHITEAQVQAQVVEQYRARVHLSRA